MHTQAIVRSGTKDVFMVDINHFPGYSGMRDFHRHMIDMIASNTRKKEVSKIWDVEITIYLTDNHVFELSRKFRTEIEGTILFI